MTEPVRYPDSPEPVETRPVYRVTPEGRAVVKVETLLDSVAVKRVVDLVRRIAKAEATEEAQDQK